MSKSKLCISSDVLYSSKFEGCSTEARLQYVYFNAETNLIGEVKRPRILARGLGFGEDVLEELIGAGLVIAVDDGDEGERFFVTHHFVNNALANGKQKEAADQLFEGVRHLIEFASDPLKVPSDGKCGKYRLANQDVSTVSLTVEASSLNVDSESKVKQSKFEATTKKSNVTSDGNVNPSSECPKCGSPWCAVLDGAVIHGECQYCGHIFIDPETGEYVEGVA